MTRQPSQDQVAYEEQRQANWLLLRRALMAEALAALLLAERLGQVDTTTNEAGADGALAEAA